MSGSNVPTIASIVKSHRMVIIHTIHHTCTLCQWFYYPRLLDYSTLWLLDSLTPWLLGCLAPSVSWQRHHCPWGQLASLESTWSERPTVAIHPCVRIKSKWDLESTWTPVNGDIIPNWFHRNHWFLIPSSFHSTVCIHFLYIFHFPICVIAWDFHCIVFDQIVDISIFIERRNRTKKQKQIPPVQNLTPKVNNFHSTGCSRTTNHDRKRGILTNTINKSTMEKGRASHFL